MKTSRNTFLWNGDIKQLSDTKNLIHGKALHPIRTLHPQEWPTVRQYLEDELIRAARTLKDKPLLLDHTQPLNGKVVDAEYKDGAIEYIAQLNDKEILEMIRSGEIKHCSVEFEWRTLENVNGVAPRGIYFTALSLLRNFQPGDQQTTVEIWEGIIKKLKQTSAKVSRAASEESPQNEQTKQSKTSFNDSSPASSKAAGKTSREQAETQEFILYTLRDPAAFLEERFSMAWVDMENGIQGVFGRLREQPENPQPQALLFMKSKGWTLEKVREWLTRHPQYSQNLSMGGITSPSQSNPEQALLLERVWDREYINSLPDDAFAIILPGGEKDETGRTVPRNLRKFPHHRADGSIDLPHLRNANARVPQSDLTPEQKRQAQEHLDKHKKALGIGEFAESKQGPFKHRWLEQTEVEFNVAPEPTTDELIQSIEDVIERVNENFEALETRVSALEKIVKAEKIGEAILSPSFISREEVVKQLRNITPERVPRHWGYGPWQLVRKQKELIRKLESRSSSDRE